LFHANLAPFFCQDYCNAYYTECFSLAGSSRKLELLSRPILKEHAMYMDSFLRQLLHIISRYLLFPFPTDLSQRFFGSGILKGTPCIYSFTCTDTIPSSLKGTLCICLLSGIVSTTNSSRLPKLGGGDEQSSNTKNTTLPTTSSSPPESKQCAIQEFSCWLPLPFASGAYIYSFLGWASQALQTHCGPETRMFLEWALLLFLGRVAASLEVDAG
jgi:hypothetical protein